MRNTLTQFLADKRGTATLEYSLLAGGVLLVMVAAIHILGVQLGDLYQTIAGGLQSVNNSH